MCRSCPERRARWSGGERVAQSSGRLHGERGHIWRVAGDAEELDEHPIAALVGQAAEEVQLWPAALGVRVQMEIAEIGRPDHHTMRQRAMGWLQVGYRLTTIGNGGCSAAVSPGAQITGKRDRDSLAL